MTGPPRLKTGTTGWQSAMQHKEEIAIEISDKIREDWDWQIKPSVIRWEDSPNLKVLCGTIIYTDEFHQYITALLSDLPAEKKGMVGNGMLIELDNDEDGNIILSRTHRVGGDYELQADEEVIHPERPNYIEFQRTIEFG
jgi:hypothetical protein